MLEKDNNLCFPSKIVNGTMCLNLIRKPNILYLSSTQNTSVCEISIKIDAIDINLVILLLQLAIDLETFRACFLLYVSGNFFENTSNWGYSQHHVLKFHDLQCQVVGNIPRVHSSFSLVLVQVKKKGSLLRSIEESYLEQVNTFFDSEWQNITSINRLSISHNPKKTHKLFGDLVTLFLKKIFSGLQIKSYLACWWSWILAQMGPCWMINGATTARFLRPRRAMVVQRLRFAMASGKLKRQHQTTWRNY